MLTYEDCLALAELTEEEVDAIAEHEKLQDGVPVLKRIILDDIREAAQKDDMERVLRLRQVLAHFVKTHPEARTSSPQDAALPE